MKPQYGLTDKEVEQMLLDSVSHAKEDMQTRTLVEAKTEANQLLATTEQFIEKNESFLSAQEIHNTKNAMRELNEQILKGKKDEIHSAIEKLNDISRPFAERIMNEAIKFAMKGKKI